MAAQDIVSRLDHCRQINDMEWVARCPAHDDRSPSLSIKDVGGGRTLIHCFAGCGANNVLVSIGLDLQDLYPPTDKNYHSEKSIKSNSIDELVIEIAKADRAAGKSLSHADLDREAEAFARLLLNEPSPGIDKNQVEKNAVDVAGNYSRRGRI